MSEFTRDDWHRLFSAAADDRLSEDEHAELATLLGSSAEARQLWFLYHDNECGLAERGVRPADSSALKLPEASTTVASAKFRRRTMAAAAGCFVIGIVCASAIFAYFAPGVGKVTTVLWESFEHGPPPGVQGMPHVAGRWGGDYSQVTKAQPAISPAEGVRMLQFLRGDSEARPDAGSHSSDVFRIVDVRPFRDVFSDGCGVVQLTALFNAVASEPAAEAYGTLTIFALDAATVERPDLVLSQDSLAYSRSSRLWLDDDPASWQEASNELRVPPETEFLMIRMGVSYDIHRNPTPPEGFAGHFADDVRLVLARRAKIPVP